MVRRRRGPRYGYARRLPHPPPPAQRQVGRQCLNVIDRRGPDLALLHGRQERTEPLRLWLGAALEQYVASEAPRALIGYFRQKSSGLLPEQYAAKGIVV